MKKSSSVNECVSLKEHSDTPFSPTKENQHYFKLDSALQQFRMAAYYSWWNWSSDVVTKRELSKKKENDKNKKEKEDWL